MKRLFEDKVLAVPAIMFTVLFWGFSYPSTKFLLTYLQPEEIAFYRFFLAAVFLSIASFFFKPAKVRKQDLFRLIAGGAVGIPLYFIFENNGINLTTAGMASMIIASIPVLNALAGTILGSEKNSPRRWFGIAMSFVGVYLIVNFGMGQPEGGRETLAGNLLVLLAAFTWVAYTRINAPLLKKYDSITVNIYQIIAGAFFLSLLALPGGIKLRQVYFVPVLLNLVYLGACCSALAYFFYMFALQKLGPIAVTTFINLVPVFGVAGGVLFLGETLLSGQLLGGVIVVAGVTLVTLPGDRALNKTG